MYMKKRHFEVNPKGWGRWTVLLCMFVLPLSVFAQKQWTLQDCIDYAMANNITLKKSQL